MMSFFVLWCAGLAEIVAFAVARYAVAALMGVRGRAARLGFDLNAWRNVSVTRRVALTVVGPSSSYVVAAACFALALSVGGQTSTDADTLRVSPTPGGAAARSGALDGDRVVSIDGAPAVDWASMRKRIKAREGESLTVVVDRDGRSVELHPVVSPSGRIEIVPFQEHRDVRAGEAILVGLESPFDVLVAAVRGLWHNLGPTELMGPVGIVNEVERTSRSRSPVAAAFRMAATLISYFLIVPVLVAIVLFPRKRRV